MFFFHPGVKYRILTFTLAELELSIFLVLLFKPSHIVSCIQPIIPYLSSPSTSSSTLLPPLPSLLLGRPAGLQVNESWSVKTSWEWTRAKCCFQMWAYKRLDVHLRWVRGAGGWVGQFRGGVSGRTERQRRGGARDRKTNVTRRGGSWTRGEVSDSLSDSCWHVMLWGKHANLLVALKRGLMAVRSHLLKYFSHYSKLQPVIT